jgi:hypothetical protein
MSSGRVKICDVRCPPAVGLLVVDRLHRRHDLDGRIVCEWVVSAKGGDAVMLAVWRELDHPLLIRDLLMWTPYPLVCVDDVLRELRQHAITVMWSVLPEYE